MKITFSTPQGVVEDDFETDRPLQALKADVLGRLRLPKEWLDQYIVAQDGNTLEQSRTLAELGVPENATLVVWRVSSTHASPSPVQDR